MGRDPEKPRIPFRDVSNAIRRAVYPKSADAVVAILRGGRVPAGLVAHHLGLPLFVVRLRFRDDRNEPLAESPALVGTVPAPDTTNGHVLLVDDVSVTGKTLEVARRLLAPLRVTTVVLKGRADLVLMPELTGGCVHWPWNEET